MVQTDTEHKKKYLKKLSTVYGLNMRIKVNIFVYLTKKGALLFI